MIRQNRSPKDFKNSTKWKDFLVTQSSSYVSRRTKIKFVVVGSNPTSHNRNVKSELPT